MPPFRWQLPRGQIKDEEFGCWADLATAFIVCLYVDEDFRYQIPVSLLSMGKTLNHHHQILLVLLSMVERSFLDHFVQVD